QQRSYTLKDDEVPYVTTSSAREPSNLESLWTDIPVPPDEAAPRPSLAGQPEGFTHFTFYVLRFTPLRFTFYSPAMTAPAPSKEILAAARAEVAKVIIGQADVIDKCLIVICTGQHALIEGVPGVAKTLLVRTLAHVLGCEFARIQFTPDLMPADIIGTNVFNLQRNEFSLIKGPVFTSFLLAAEINRAPAKTQSALLQAMQERIVTIDRDTHVLPSNFTVFATQNPIEYEGTYPLPEAQKDRFMLKITMKTPD